MDRTLSRLAIPNPRPPFPATVYGYFAASCDEVIITLNGLLLRPVRPPGHTANPPPATRLIDAQSVKTCTNDALPSPRPAEGPDRCTRT